MWDTVPYAGMARPPRMRNVIARPLAYTWNVKYFALKSSWSSDIYTQSSSQEINQLVKGVEF